MDCEKNYTMNKYYIDLWFVLVTEDIMKLQLLKKTKKQGNRNFLLRRTDLETYISINWLILAKGRDE